MNILHTETLKGWGGQQNKVLKECIALRELGHNVSLVCNPNSIISNKFRSNGFQVIEQEMNKGNFHRTIPFFTTLIKKENINLIITHGSTDSWIGGISARLSANKPIAFRERHNLFPIRSRLSKWLHQSLFHGILSISPTVTEYLQSIHVKPDRIHALPDSVDSTSFNSSTPSIRMAHHIPDDSIVVGSFTSHRPQKGVWDLYKLCRSLLEQPNIWFIFAGGYQQNIKEEIMKSLSSDGYDTERVIWTGFREDAADVFASFDIFVHLSHSEGLGTVVLEAMASKLPILVWDIRPMSDLVKYDNGLCIPFSQHEKAAEAALSLSSDADRRKRLGLNGHNLIKKEFDDSKLKARLEMILNSINHT